MGAEKVIAAQKGKQKIAVEVKSFLGPSPLTEFHISLGQYLNYQLALDRTEPERKLYLAVPENSYRKFFTLPFVQAALETYGLRLIIYRADDEEIVIWTG